MKNARRRWKDLPPRVRSHITRTLAVLSGDAAFTAQELADAAATVAEPVRKRQAVIEFPRTPVVASTAARAPSRDDDGAGQEGTP